jgi:hypothetical protein
MSVYDTARADLPKAAYAVAWDEFKNFKGLTPDDEMYGPNRLRSYIQMLVDAGENDPAKNSQSRFGHGPGIRTDSALENTRRQRAGASCPSLANRI